MNRKADVERLSDGQPIEFWRQSGANGKWWWAFYLLEENDKDWYGPFTTRAAAIKEAEDYINDLAP